MAKPSVLPPPQATDHANDHAHLPTEVPPSPPSGVADKLPILPEDVHMSETGINHLPDWLF